MRLWLTSLILAAVFLLPPLAELMDFSLHGWEGYLRIPDAGLGYMLVFFHELGHCVTYWSFGYPAIPTFDFTYGGGMTYAIDHYWVLQGVVYAGAAGLIYYLCRGDGFFFDNERYPLLISLVLLVILHLCFAFNEGRLGVSAFMGYGGEIAIAVFCIVRAHLGLTLYGTLERYLNMVFGWFIIGNNLILLGGLIISDIARDAYAQQKGQELAGDFDQIALMLGWSVQSVAKGALSYMAFMLLGGAIFIWWWRKNEEVSD